jgi:hypothetical protein
MADDRPPGSSSGLLPPDGVAWPPEPAPPPVAPAAPSSLPGPDRRPADATVADWRTMAVEAPDGYRGSASAPAIPAARVDLWSVCAVALAAVGLIPLLWRVPVASALAVGFGLAGRRSCALDPTRRGRTLATVGLAVGAATLFGVVVAVAGGRLTLFDV